MNNVVRSIFLTTLLTGMLQLPVRAQSSVQIPAGSVVEVTLLKPLDAKKNKVGDEVDAKVMRDLKADDKVVIAKNSKLIGHLADVRAKSKDQQSLVTINFERAVLKEGGETPVTATIQALAKPYDAAESNDLLRGAGPNQTLSGPAEGVARSGGGLGGSPGVLTLKSQGVLGYTGIGLHGSTVYSSSLNVHLDSGTHMILQVSGK